MTPRARGWAAARPPAGGGGCSMLPPMLRRPSLAAAALTLAFACSKGQEGPTGPGGGGQVCTQIGCVDGLQIELARGGPWPPVPEAEPPLAKATTLPYRLTAPIPPWRRTIGRLAPSPRDRGGDGDGR